MRILDGDNNFWRSCCRTARVAGRDRHLLRRHRLDMTYLSPAASPRPSACGRPPFPPLPAPVGAPPQQRGLASRSAMHAVAL